MTKKIDVVLLIALVIGGVFCSCCGSDGPFTPEVLQAYLNENKEDVDDFSNYSVYVDYTDCLKLACDADSNTKRKLEFFVGKTGGIADRCNGYYALKDDSIQALGKPNKETFNNIYNQGNYKWTAPIEKALRRITQKNEGAVLITDFEEYQDGKIFRGDFASRYFIPWIQRGNNITFFIFDFEENGFDKHLYVTVFDSPKQIVLNDVKDALSQGEINYQMFNLNNSLFSTKTDYDWKAYGGNYRNNAGEDCISFTQDGGEGDCYCYFDGCNAEYYPFGEPWEYIVKNIADDRSLESSERDGEVPYKDLISGLHIDFSRMSGYRVEKLSLKMTGIQPDFDAFRNSMVEESVKYQPVSCGAIYDMFVFTGMISNNRADVAIDIKPGFSGKVANMNGSDMVRVDVLIEKCSVNDGVLGGLFAWNDKGGSNNSLKDAVLNTLQECTPTGKVVYSYFVQCL